MQRELVERAKAGDHDAFTILAKRAFPRLRGTASLILRDGDRAQDAVQEALVLAWLNVRAVSWGVLGSIGAGTWRIENERGAWQGSYPVALLFDNATASTATVALVGEGDYEGFVAVWVESHDPLRCEWDVRGVIIEGEVPAIPEPFVPDA